MRPKVICHIMSSVDGRILPGRWTLPFDATPAGELFKEYSEIGRLLETDAWMFGKATTRESFPYKFMPKSEQTVLPGLVFIPSSLSQRLMEM